MIKYGKIIKSKDKYPVHNNSYRIYSKLLLDIKKEVNLTKNKHNALPLDKIKEFELKYNEILKAGFDEDYAKNTKLYSNLYALYLKT